MVALTVNGTLHEVDVDPEVPLLWVLRDHLGLTGTKFGCGKAICGACTVHIDGRAARSCQTPVGAVAGKAVTTMEGLPADHPVKRAWIAGEVVQCGYCQPGQIMQAAALFAEDGRPSEEKIVEAMDCNLCRRGTYPRILAALAKLAKEGGAPRGAAPASSTCTSSSGRPARRPEGGRGGPHWRRRRAGDREEGRRRRDEECQAAREERLQGAPLRGVDRDGDREGLHGAALKNRSSE